LLDLGLNSDSVLLKRDGFLAVAAHRMAKSLPIIGVDCYFVARTTNRDVKLLSIHQLDPSYRVNVHDHVIDRRTLARMGS
jgi:hypothetical protein